MKTKIFSGLLIGWMILLLATPLLLEAQSPQSFSYQAIVRGSDANPLADQTVSVQVKIHQGNDTGPVVYCETHSPTTNPFGLVNLEIGQGSIVSGSFPAINWESGLYFLEIELDPEGGTSYVPMGTTKLVSVPYALFSENTGQIYSAGTGIDISSYTITNTAPDQTITLNSGTGINVTGTYPIFTVTNSAPDQLVNVASGNGISVGGTYPNFTVTNTAPNALHTGDATGSGALTVVQIQGMPVSAAAPAVDQVLQWNGSQWNPGTLPAVTPAWSLTGNSGTDPGVNFLGTTDTKPLIFKVNNFFAGEIHPTDYNTFLGLKAGGNSAGTYNTAHGSHALSSNTTGWGNTALGAQAMYSNTTGNTNYASGNNALYYNVGRSRNTAVGYFAMSNACNQVGTVLTYNTAVGFEAMKGSIEPAENTGSYNTAIGGQSLFNNTSGNNNTATGYQALYSNTSGQFNVATGNKALYSNLTGTCNTANGYWALQHNEGGGYNTAVGTQALYDNTEGNYNTAAGNQALYENIDGYYNTATGNQALLDNINGDYNSAYGFQALYHNKGNSRSTAVGCKALYYADDRTAGRNTYNTAVGYEALRGSITAANNTGQDNTAIGDQSLYANTSGSHNVASGSLALYSNTSGSNNTANGHTALYTSTEGEDNTAVGYGTLFFNAEGDQNAAIGSQALYYNTNGQNNIAVGYKSLFQNRARGRSTAIGVEAMYNAYNGTSVSSSYNTAVGYGALYGSSNPSNNHGSDNTAVGDQSMYKNSSGDNNAALGSLSLYSNTSGNHNTAVGYSALHDIIDDSYNIGLGYSAGRYYEYSYSTFMGASCYPTADGFSNCMALGYNARVNASNKVVIGNTSVNSIGGYEPWTDFSDGRFKKNIHENVPGLEFVEKLRPVTYTLDITTLNADLDKNIPCSLHEREQPHELSSEEMESIAAKEMIVYTGFIAQEVEEAAQSIGYDFRGVDVPQNPDGHYGLRYAEFVAPLVRAIQEQQVMIEKLQEEVRQLKENQAAK